MSGSILWKQEIGRILPPEDIFADEPMDRHTTFRAGGRAALFAYVRSVKALRKCCGLLAGEGVPYLIIGKGSNLLVSDAGYPGALLCLTGAAFRSCAMVRDADDRQVLRTGAAVPLSELAHIAAEHGIAGFVPLSGIPGTVGGALTMNAGAYGGEMKDVVLRVEALDAEAEGLPAITLPAEDMAFGYRTSLAKKRRLLFLSADFLTDQHEDPETLIGQMRLLAETRKEKQPLEYPSAGSTFKRPEGAFAAKLIEDAGLKGTSVGGAQVSEKHAGFLVNKGGATASDIIALMRKVRNRVEETSGIRLEAEVILLGEEL